MTENDYILIGSIIKEQSRNCQQGIEPATSLVNSLRNEICWITVFKNFLVLKWIMPLSKRHRTGIEPAVNNLWNTLHFLTALWAVNGNIVDVWAMKLDIVWAVVGHLL